MDPIRRLWKESPVAEGTHCPIGVKCIHLLPDWACSTRESPSTRPTPSTPLSTPHGEERSLRALQLCLHMSAGNWPVEATISPRPSRH
jgi:hypothetical protein